MIESSTDSDLVDELTEVELGLAQPRSSGRIGDPVLFDILGKPAIETDRSLEQALAEVLHPGLAKQKFSGDPVLYSRIASSASCDCS